MTQQTINLGSAPNDGTGDPLRTAFDKCNDNFTELYTDVAGSVPAGPITTSGLTIGTDKLAGRDTASTGALEEIGLTGGLEFNGSGSIRIADGGVTYAKIQDVSAASKILGRGDSGSGDVQEITLGTGLTMTGTTLSASGSGLADADYGDFTVSGGVATIDNNVVTFAKIQDIATDRLIGRDTASSGDPEEITVGGGLEFTGSGGIQIANDGVTYAKIQNVSATDRLLGRSTAGAGDVEEITCTAAGRALLDDANAAAQLVTLGAAASGAVTSSGLTMATNRLLGRITASTGAVEEVAPGLGMELASGALRRASGTSFPGSPSSGDLFWRSDRNIEYVYDGTRWLSTQLLTHMLSLIDNIIMPMSGTGTPAYANNPWVDKYDIYVEEVVWWWTLTGTGNWTFDVKPVAAGVLGTAFGSKTVSASGTDGDRIAVNAVKTSGNERFQITATENSGTATVYAQGTLVYRLVG